jgi:hypothetical protein
MKLSALNILRRNMAKSTRSSTRLFSSFVRTIFVLLFLIINFYDCTFAQFLDRKVIASGGNQFTSPTLTVSSTLGETFVYTLAGGGIILTQGFQQPEYTPCSLQINDGIDTVFACGDSVELKADSGLTSYSWNSGESTQVLFAKTTGWYVCTGSVGGCTGIDSIFVSIIDAEIAMADTSICLGSSISLGVSTSNGSTNGMPLNLQSGLVGWWPFNGNANDESGNGNHGIVTSANLASDRNNNSSKAYSFNGVNSSIRVPNASTFNYLLNSDYTINTFVHFSQIPVAAQTILGQGDGDGLHENKFYQLYLQNGDFVGHIRGNGSDPLDTRCSSAIPTANQWYMLSMVRDYNDSLKLFVNGHLVQAKKDTTGLANPFQSNRDLIFGAFYDAYTNSLSHHFAGKIDDISVYNRSFSNSEVSSYYSAMMQGAYSYLWSNGSTTSSISVTPNQTTTYYVTISNGVSSCSDSVTIAVNNFNPSLFSQDTIAACGPSCLLDAGLSYSAYTWSTGATTQSISVYSTGWYNCTVTSGTCTGTDSVFVSLLNVAIDQPDTSICLGATLTLSVANLNNATNLLPVNLQSDLVGWWPFNGNANDESGYGRNGIVNGATLTTDRNGSASSAYHFNGTGAHIASSCDGFSTNERTISFWFNAEDIGQGPSGRSFIGYGGNGNCGTSSLIMIDNAASGGNDYEISGHCSNEQVKYDYGNVHPNNQWIHWVITNKGGIGTRFYLNGNLVHSSSTYIQQTFTSGRKLFFGVLTDWSGMNAYWDVNSAPLKGKLDDISIYNRAVTPSEVQQLYGNSALMYVWSNGSTSSSINVTPNQTTTYYVTVSNGISSCIDSVTITVLPGAIPYYADTDGDTFGDSLLGHFCIAPPGGLTDSSDCDGNNPLIYPDAPEVCNSIDDDCDGVPDDGLAPVIGAISGNNVQCIPLSSGSASFSIAPVPGANSYFWLAPTGTTITSGQGTPGVTISWNTAAAHSGINAPITVTVTGACGQLSSAQSIDLHLQISVPVRPSSISGPLRLCPGDTAVYSVASVSRARTYTWSLPAGLQMISGHGTNIIRVFAEATYLGGTMAVSASNACGTGTDRIKVLSLNIPSTPFPIVGAATGLCEVSGVAYTVPLQNGIGLYQWSVPAGAQIVSGQGSNQITVNFNSSFTTGNLNVQAVNACGPSAARSLALTAVPARPGLINGPLNLCPGATGVQYSVATVNGTTAYNWSVFTGAIITGGAGTKNITIDVPSTNTTGNNITVSASNTCGSGPIKALNGITVSTAACARIDGMANNSIKVFPNPSNGLVRFQIEGETPISLQLYDMLGKCISNTPWKSECDLRYLPEGLYVMRAFYENGVEERLKVEIHQ